MVESIIKTIASEVIKLIIKFQQRRTEDKFLAIYYRLYKYNELNFAIHFVVGLFRSYEKQYRTLQQKLENLIKKKEEERTYETEVKSHLLLYKFPKVFSKIKRDYRRTTSKFNDFLQKKEMDNWKEIRRKIFDILTKFEDDNIVNNIIFFRILHVINKYPTKDIEITKELYKLLTREKEYPIHRLRYKDDSIDFIEKDEWKRMKSREKMTKRHEKSLFKEWKKS